MSDAPPPVTATILIVDDDALLRRALADRLQFWGHTVVEAPDGDAALAATTARQFDLVLLDLAMPGRSGIEVLKELRASGYGADVVVLTAHGSLQLAVESIREGAVDFLQKPADFDLLRAVVDRSIERRRLRNANRALFDRVDEASGAVVSASPGMQQVLELAARAAASKATVLITGESGTGKQVVAEFIHRRSERRGAFVYVNCVALSDELVESTLFGHERGAFTGAVARKQGRLEAAHGGTGFLDEIGDVSPRLQTKLLHFLETGDFERVGGTSTITVDCRIVAATNRDLAQAMRQGTFREDLYYRLNVITVRVPPLRERRDDILPLASSFVDRFGRELGRTGLQLVPRTCEILHAYAWPGNVRQLRNAMERIVVLANGELLGPDLLPPEVRGGSGDGAPDLSSLSYKQAVREAKRRLLRDALARAGGNQTRAAEQLGIQRTFLNRLLKELQV